MSIELKFVNISGTRLEFTGSHPAQIVILCGVSGNSVVPIATMADGTLLVSGPQ